jgi:hypothetical protein
MNHKKLEFNVLSKSITYFSNWNGINAKNWASYFYNKNIHPNLDYKLTRSELLDTNFTKDLNDEELAIAILSWGGMNREHGKSLFEHKEWIDIITKMRNNEIVTRKVAYELFAELRKNKKLKGMGPAYFTKLICFVNPNFKGYIMDQWTSKSINLLFDNKIVFLNNNGNVTDKNTAEIYEDFCIKIECLAELLKLNPIDLEENLFSNGGINKGKWRQFVVDNWSSNLKTSKTSKKIKTLNIDMEPINFETALQYLIDNEIEITTLGGQKKLKVNNNDNFIYITNSKNKTLKVDMTLWNKVINRLKDLPNEERAMSSRYGVGNKKYNWQKCPNRNAAYISAIIKHLCK